MSDLTGKSIGGGSGAGAVKAAYAVSELIAQNGKTFLYKAIQAGNNQEVFIKYFQLDEINPEIAQKICAQFEVEAQILVEISHPSMASAIDYGFYEENPFLVMKFVQGKTIETMLGKPVPTGETTKILGPVSRAFNYANKKGVSLRDIHPGNIWINQVGESILTAYAPPSEAEMTQPSEPSASGGAFTRPNYTAPEQWSGNVSEQSDIYSLGIVTYELITGQKLFAQDTPEGVIQAQAEGITPQPTQFVPDLSEDVQNVIASALAADPAERYTDGSKMAILFERISHRETSWYTEQLQETTEIKAKSKKLPLQWIIIGAVAVVVVIVVIIFATKKQPAATVAEATQPPVVATESVAGESTASSGETTAGEPTDSTEPTEETSTGVTIGRVYVGSQQETLKAYEEGVTTIKSLVGEATAAGTQQNYSLNLETSQPLLWTTTWCATTEEILQENLDNITYSFTINGLPVSSDNIVERRYVRESDQLQCADKMILLDQFQAGREKLVLKEVSLKVLNNGIEDTPPRQYYERITIEIAE